MSGADARHLAKAPLMKLHVGQAALQGGIRRYPFDLLELLAEAHMPQPKILARWRAERPDRVFALRLPPGAVQPGSERQQALERISRARETLAAAWGVVTSPATITPTARNRDLLAALFDELRGDAWRLAWEPRGVWAPDETEEWAQALGVTLIRDLSREDPPPGPVVYTRLRALGFGAKVGPRAMERVAERLDEVDEAYVVIEGQGAVRAAALLRESLGGADEVTP